MHIIENRFKLEREIIRGRQNVRPANSRDRVLHDSLVQRQPKLFEGIPPLHQGQLRTGVPFPPQLAIESDAEAAFAKGSSRFFKRHHHHSLSISPPKLSSSPASDNSSKSIDPLASVEGRQKWATTLLESGAAPSQDAGATHGPRVTVSGFNNHTPLSTRTPSPSSSPVLPQSPSFFTRLQRRSFASIPAAFSTFRRNDANVENRVQEDGSWSSDSSSSDYPLDESRSHLHRTSIFPEANGCHNELSSDENGNADDGLKDTVDDDYPEQDK